MELFEFFKFLYRQKIMIIGIAVIGLIAGYVYAKQQPITYQSSVLVYVQRETQLQTGEYFNYDGYYALQTSTQYADTVIGLIKSLDVLKRGAEITNFIPTNTKELQKLSSKIKVTKTAPQLITITLSDTNQEKARAVVLALAQASQDRIRLLNQTGDKALVIGLVNENPIVITSTPSAMIYGAVGLGFGLVLGLLSALLVDFIGASKTLAQKDK